MGKGKERERNTLIRMNILIMLSLLRLRTRRINRPIRESLALLQPRRNRNPMDSSRLLVLVPRGTGDVPADDSLNGQNLELAHLHAAVLENGTQRRGDLRGKVER